MEIEKTTAKEIADLIEQVHAVDGDNRALVCARDCMLQWDEGGIPLLLKTMTAWRKDLVDAKEGGSRCACDRHGAWPPAIPI